MPRVSVGIAGFRFPTAHLPAPAKLQTRVRGCNLWPITESPGQTAKLAFPFTDYSKETNQQIMTDTPPPG